MGNELGQEFMLAGWGTGGNMHDTHDRSMSVLRRGFNVVSRVHDNLIYYNFDSLEQGGHELEVHVHKGDSGSGALFLVGD